MLPDRLRRVVERELGRSRTAAALAEEFLRRSGWSPALGERLLAAARAGEWRIRLAAALMLEHHALRHPDALAFLRDAIGESDDLLPRLARLRHVHDRIAGTKTSVAAWSDFLRLVRTPCRIAIARHFVTPAEVVERILAQVDMSSGTRDIVPGESPHLMNETELAMRETPAYEREIAQRLCDLGRVFWVAPRTPSHLHGLVEYPVGTVVLVVKPPGSDIEIEIKRAGLRGPRPIDVFFSRGVNIIPPSHHLRGGSGGRLLDWERAASNLLSRIYRLVHGVSPAVSHTLAMTTIVTLPLHGQEVFLLRYFDDPNIYPGDYDVMRRHMTGSLRHMENLKKDPQCRTTLELTGRFIGSANPTQGIQLGNSSFRFDRVATYLSPGGPDAYFRNGLERDRTIEEEYGLADELFEEILPGFEPVPRRGGYAAYVRATLRRNRELADRCYFDCLAQLGTMWGTVVGVRGGSEGESFVSRNVGLRARFENGAWRVRVVFMDHDALNITGRREANIYPRYRGRAMASDFRHVFGSRAGKLHVVGSAPMLARIYKPSAAVRLRGDAIVRAAAVAAHETTTNAFATNIELRKLFHQQFVRRHADWHIVVSRFVALRGGVDRWRKWTKRYLRGRGYGKSLVQEYLDSIPRWGYVWRRAGFLYGGATNQHPKRARNVSYNDVGA